MALALPDGLTPQRLRAAFEAADGDQRARLAVLLEQWEAAQKQRQFWTYFPDEGPLRRELYPKHMAFFEASAWATEILFLAGNRVGKTESGGGYATVCHLTGRYPDWWPGRRFDGPIQAWCAGDTMETTRDIQQFKLLGPPHAWGTGVMPGEDIGEIRLRRGVENAVASVRVRHQSGGWSTLGFKSYDQGRRNFQGTERHVIWLDEECPLPVYEECITRTMATPRFEGGLVMLTFTPLKGLSPVVLHFLPSGRLEG